MAKIKGLNPKEQKCFDMLKDGQQWGIREMKAKFMTDARKHCEQTYEKGWDDSHVEYHAQSFVRNGIRRLIRDGWVRKVEYGTYALTTHGKKWVTAGKDTTKSFGTKRGRKPGTKAVAEKKAPVKKVAKAAAKKAPVKKVAKAATKKKAPAKKVAKAATTKKATTKKNGKSTVKQAKSAAKKVVVEQGKAAKKSAVMKKAQAAKKRVGKLVAMEKAKVAKASAAAASAEA